MIYSMTGYAVAAFELPFGARITRGKVEVRITVNKTSASQSGLQVDEKLLGQLKQLNDNVMTAIPESAPLTVNDVLRWPGMLGNDTLQLDDLQEACGRLLQRALDDLTATRAR